MSDTSKNRRVSCKFGIINLKGLMDVDSSGDICQVQYPLFCHESYKIRTTFDRNLDESFGILNGDNIPLYDGKYYQKMFRKHVLWDFGDGTQKEGYYAEHSYKRAGKYKISCMFFDINRKSWVNDYSIHVIVKEVLPTMIQFDKEFTKSQVKCSKPERIARLQAFNSQTVKNDLKIKIERIFDEEYYEDTEKNYESLDNSILKDKNAYWTLMENTKQFYYNTNEVFSENLVPTKIFTPKYDKIYGKFYYNQITDEIDLALYQVIPYKNIDNNLKKIPVLNPNVKLNLKTESHKNFDVHQVYLEEQLPKDVSYVGKRAWVDVFYKCDFLGDDNTFSIFFDIEEENIDGYSDSSPNYINIVPLGFNVNVLPNDIHDVKVAMTTDGFIRLDDGVSIGDDDCFIDKHLMGSLFQDLELDVFLFPFIKHENGYYIPKDLSINCKVEFNDCDSHLFENVKRVFPWFVRVPFGLGSTLDSMVFASVDSDTEEITFEIPFKKQLLSLNEIIIPKEHQHRENIDRLLDVYLSHPMWNEKNNVREMFRLLLGNGYLDTVMTNSKNFIDNTQNVRTCYLSNLISMLQSMGEDVSLYEFSNFEGNNELKGFVRLLSMNHSELVGHLMDETPEIKISLNDSGSDVGQQIDITSILTLDRDKKLISIDDEEILDNFKGDIILRDNYTNETKIVSFFTVPEDTISLCDYNTSWGWNLLLPNEFFKINEKIEVLKKQNQNKAYSQSKIAENQKEIVRLSEIKNKIIAGYYSFYLFNNNSKQKRIGNFIDDSYVTERIEDVSDWDAYWGVAHEILMKILIENCGLNKTDEMGVRVGDCA